MSVQRPVRLSRRRLLGVLGGAFLTTTTACGMAQPTPVATTSGTAQGSAPSPAVAASPVASERVVKHAMGEAKVSSYPERVVALDTGELDSALAVGVKPIGAVTWFQDGGFQGYLKDKTEGVKQVGTISQPNLETVAALKPDLILSSKMRHEDIYDKLTQIAPTVFTERVGVTWKENLMLHAEALNKRAVADDLMRTYDTRLADFKTTMGDRLATTQVSVIRSFPDQIRLYAKGSFIGTILEDAGLPRPASQSATDKTFVTATKENIPDMDADVIFVLHTDASKGSQIKDMMADPLWQNLKAVKAGMVYEVPDDIWALGIGILAASEVIDDLYEHLAR